MKRFYSLRPSGRGVRDRRPQRRGLRQLRRPVQRRTTTPTTRSQTSTAPTARRTAPRRCSAPISSRTTSRSTCRTRPRRSSTPRYQWNLVTGPHGSIIDRYQIDKLTDLTPGGAAQSLLAVPYYRDDSCFDDGTGTDPGPRVRLRSADEPRTTGGRRAAQVLAPVRRRPGRQRPLLPGLDRDARPAHPARSPTPTTRARPIPLTEIVAEQRLVMLPGWAGRHVRASSTAAASSGPTSGSSRRRRTPRASPGRRSLRRAPCRVPARRRPGSARRSPRSCP